MIQSPCVWSLYYISIFQKRIRCLSVLTLAEFPPSHSPRYHDRVSCPGLLVGILTTETQFLGGGFECQLLLLGWTQDLNLFFGPTSPPASPRTTNSIQWTPCASLTSSQTWSWTKSISKPLMDLHFLLQNSPSACLKHILFRVLVRMG